jgi:hypothetical protein
MRYLSFFGLISINGILTTYASSFTPRDIFEARIKLTGTKLSREQVETELEKFITEYNRIVAKPGDLSDNDNPYSLTLFTVMCELSIRGKYNLQHECNTIDSSDADIKNELVHLMNEEGSGNDDGKVPFHAYDSFRVEDNLRYVGGKGNRQTNQLREIQLQREKQELAEFEASEAEVAGEKFIPSSAGEYIKVKDYLDANRPQNRVASHPHGTVPTIHVDLSTFLTKTPTAGGYNQSPSQDRGSGGTGSSKSKNRGSDSNARTQTIGPSRIAQKKPQADISQNMGGAPTEKLTIALSDYPTKQYTKFEINSSHKRTSQNQNRSATVDGMLNRFNRFAEVRMQGGPITRQLANRRGKKPAPTNTDKRRLILGHLINPTGQENKHDGGQSQSSRTIIEGDDSEDSQYAIPANFRSKFQIRSRGLPGPIPQKL